MIARLPRFLILKNGQSYSVTDNRVSYSYPRRFSTQRAAFGFADKIIEWEDELRETAQILDGWTM